jgi:hypothetical protein
LQTEIILALVAFVVALFLRRWQAAQRLLWPLNLFAVLIHELMHGLAAIVSGGQFTRFEMYTHGGVAYTRGGRRALILPAGYVGTALFGAVLLVVTNSVEQPGVVAVALGIAFGALTLFFSGMGVHKLNVLEFGVMIVTYGLAIFLFIQETPASQIGAVVVAAVGAVLVVMFMADEYFFTALVGFATALGLLFLGLYVQGGGNPEIVRFVLNFLAFMVGLNTIFDSWYLFHLISTDNNPDAVPDDATAMSREVGLPAAFWATLWSANSVVMLSVAMVILLV